MSDETIPISIDVELDALFGQYTASGRSMGLVYGRVAADGLAHATGFGVADDEGRTPDADTVFPIASMTKSFVACAALIARDRGQLSLDDPITKYFPEFTASGTTEDPCDPPTLGMLLSMSGGLTEDNAWVDPYIDAPEEEVLAQVAHGLRYSHVPGAVFEYSNLGYTLAGLAVGRAVGKPVEDYVRDEVLVPLGMTSSHFDNALPDDGAPATGYSLDAEATWVPYPFNASGAFAAAGGLMSTVRDLATWVRWLGAAFRSSNDGDVDILSRASRREMQRMHIVDLPAVTTESDGSVRPSFRGYGLGLQIGLDLRRGTLVAHGGGLPGFSLYMLWHPDSGDGMVVLTNSHRGDPSALCVDGLGRILTREKAAAETIVLWSETVQLRAEVEKLVRGWDDDVAARIFAANVDFDRPLVQRRAEVEELVEQIGPLRPARPVSEVVSAATPADVTWSIPGDNGELICMVHLTPVDPAQVQEFVVRAVPFGTPRSAAPVDISPRRTHLGEAYLGPLPNTRVVLPE